MPPRLPSRSTAVASAPAPPAPSAAAPAPTLSEDDSRGKAATLLTTLFQGERTQDIAVQDIKVSNRQHKCAKCDRHLACPLHVFVLKLLHMLVACMAPISSLDMWRALWLKC